MNSYPRMKYHPTMGHCPVMNEDQDKMLGEVWVSLPPSGYSMKEITFHEALAHTNTLAKVDLLEKKIDGIDKEIKSSGKGK